MPIEAELLGCYENKSFTSNPDWVEVTESEYGHWNGFPRQTAINDCKEVCKKNYNKSFGAVKVSLTFYQFTFGMISGNI